MNIHSYVAFCSSLVLLYIYHYVVSSEPQIRHAAYFSSICEKTIGLSKVDSWNSWKSKRRLKKKRYKEKKDTEKSREVKPDDVLEKIVCIQDVKRYVDWNVGEWLQGKAQYNVHVILYEKTWRRNYALKLCMLLSLKTNLQNSKEFRKEIKIKVYSFMALRYYWWLLKRALIW